MLFFFSFCLDIFLFQVLSSHDVYSDKRTIKEIQEEKSLQLVTEASRRSDTRSTSERVVLIFLFCAVPLSMTHLCSFFFFLLFF